MRHQFLQCYLCLESSADLNIVEVGKDNFSIIEVEKVMINDSNPVGIDVTTSDLDNLINITCKEIRYTGMTCTLNNVYICCVCYHI